MAATRPENSPTPCRSAPSRGNWLADPVEPAIELADGPEGLARLGQLLGLEDTADLGPPHERADVVQAAERGPQPGADRLDHLGGEGLAVVDLGRVDARLEAQRPGLPQRAGGPRGDQGPDLVELEKFQRVAVHV